MTDISHSTFSPRNEPRRDGVGLRAPHERASTSEDFRSPSNRAFARNLDRRLPSRPRSLVRRWSTIILWLSLAGTGTRLVSPDPTALRPSDVGFLGVSIALVALLVGLLFFRRPASALLRGLRENPLTSVLGLFAILSLIWSVAPRSGLEGVARYFAGLLFASILAYRRRPDEVMQGLYVATVLGSAGSVALYIVRPDIATYSTGVWVGLYGWNSVVGSVAGLALALGVWLPQRLVGTPLVRLLSFVLSASCLYLSDSRAAQIATVLAILVGALWYLRDGRNRYLINVVLFVLILPVATIIAFMPELRDSVALSMGRTTSASGRTDIWRIVWGEIGQRPFLGWGWNSYWSSPYAERAFFTWYKVPQDSHNQFLEMLLQLGVLGPIFFIAMILTTWRFLVSRSSQLSSFWLQSRLGPASLSAFAMCMVPTFSNGPLFRNSYLAVLFFWLYFTARKMRKRTENVN